MAASVLGLFLAGGSATAQVASSDSTSSAPTTLRFVKEANETWAPVTETTRPDRTVLSSPVPTWKVPRDTPRSTSRRGFRWPWSSADEEEHVSSTYVIPSHAKPPSSSGWMRWPWSKSEERDVSTTAPRTELRYFPRTTTHQKPAATAEVKRTPVAPVKPSATAAAGRAFSTTGIQPVGAATPAGTTGAAKQPGTAPTAVSQKPTTPAVPEASAQQTTPKQGPDSAVPTLIDQIAAMQVVPDPTGLPQQELQDYQMFVQLEPPGPQRLFRLENEAQFQERMRQEARQRPVPEHIHFPEEPVLTDARYAGRAWPRMEELAEPNYVCYGRLYFHRPNTERYGWDLGMVQPFLSASAFYADVVTLPYHMGTAPCRKYECSAGYCLPGSAVPYLLYPEEFSVTGLVAEAAVIAGLAAIFP